jgi:hypothetical protein
MVVNVLMFVSAKCCVVVTWKDTHLKLKNVIAVKADVNNSILSPFNVKSQWKTTLEFVANKLHLFVFMLHI